MIESVAAFHPCTVSTSLYFPILNIDPFELNCFGFLAVFTQYTGLKGKQKKQNARFPIFIPKNFHFYFCGRVNAHLNRTEIKMCLHQLLIDTLHCFTHKLSHSFRHYVFVVNGSEYSYVPALFIDQHEFHEFLTQTILF